jgi:hypothetical protein
MGSTLLSFLNSTFLSLMDPNLNIFFVNARITLSFMVLNLTCGLESKRSLFSFDN